MRIRIITKDNGVGLSQDIRVIKEAIAYWRNEAPGRNPDFLYSEWNSNPKGDDPKVDLNIHLELMGVNYIGKAHKNIYVPNPEWYYANLWDVSLRRIDEVWCKTEDCLRIFKQRHHNAVFTGWTSQDRYVESIDRKKTMIHVAGLSSAKGTVEVLQAMEHLKDHHLILVTGQDRGRLPANVENVGKVSEERLAELMNMAMVHLCPSSYEGFGHYINEARSVGAVIITTNAAPMTDLVTRAYGFGASVTTVSNQNLAQHKHVDVSSLIGCIESAMNREEEWLYNVGQKARQHYLTDRAAFHRAIAARL